jgi:two-component sensor histidine kinase
MPKVPSTRSLLIVIVLLAGFGSVTAFGLLAYADYRATSQDAERNLREVARLIEEHAKVALRAGAIQLFRVSDLIDDRDPDELRDSRPDWDKLNRIMRDVPFAHSIAIFNRRADLVLSTLQPTGIALNVADRDYFRALQSSNPASDPASDQEIFISPLIRSRITGDLLFTMSRRLSGPDGQFRGVAASSLNTRYFSDFYKELRPASDSVFAVIKADGALVVRSPLPTAEITRETTLRSPLFTTWLARGPVGTYRARSVIDGRERLVVYRRVEGYPLIVTTGLPIDAVFGPWWERTLHNGLFAASGLGALLLLAGLAFLSIRRETASQHRYEDKAAQLGRALADRNVLFQEVHHRVKNNLQVVASLLRLQSSALPDRAAQSVFQDALDRIHSMGLVHHALYQREEAAEVNMATYLVSLADSLSSSHHAQHRGITLTVNAADCTLDLDRAVPLALIANEALTNALKYAFPDGQSGQIQADLRRADGDFVLTVTDDGIGIPAEAVDAGRPSLGIHLMRSLARQLGGTVEFRNQGGTVAQVRFPLQAVVP